MSATNPAFTISRKSVVGEENEWVKMFDPPTESPATPELLEPTNPVPEFMQSLGLLTVPNPHTVQRQLMHSATIKMWDGKPVNFFLFTEPGNPATNNGTFPAPTIRVPRGVIFQGETQGSGPPPHTIHWHGIEPTPINDGVGHCSMEVGKYIYQWQPNFIGSYFYHCHRNTVQHFEFGLYGFLIIEPPDAYSGANPGGYPRRTAANLAKFPQFPGFVGGDLANGDPHAMTIPYDVEALWVLDDRDSKWSDLAPSAFTTFPDHGFQPGDNDRFRENIGGSGFFAFNDFNPDYFFCTGVGFPAPVGSTVSLAPKLTVPAALNGGVTGMQISVDAKVNQTIMIRALCAAYVNIKISFPLDVVIIAIDGRALGVPPFARYNQAFLLPKDTQYELSTARRIGALIRSDTPIDSFAKVEFLHNRTGELLMTGRIPIRIT